MTRQTEIKTFAVHYSLTIEETTILFQTFAKKPAEYRPVLNIDANAKTVKGQEYGYLTGVVYLAPADLSGHKVCYDYDLCKDLCLNLEGRGGFTATQVARIRKTQWAFDQSGSKCPETGLNKAFMDSLVFDVFGLLRKAVKRNLKPAFRANGTSDLPKIAWVIARLFPFLNCYDYTKRPNAWTRTRPNYHLTFSRSGQNDAACVEALANGINVTVVFHKGETFPETFWGVPVVDGDKNDLRFLDPVGVVVALHAKGRSGKKAKASNSPFIILGQAA